ncbi:MAG: YciI family protein [Pseudomonadota bacterium]
MPFLILFEDALGHDDTRAAHMQAHLSFLAAHGDTVRAAGPLFDQGAAAGGAWVVEVETRQAAQALVEADPFWPTGLRKSVRILEWRHVFADGAAV